MEHLSNIVAEISKIEDRATTLIDAAQEEKNQLSQNQEKRIKEFDADLLQKTKDDITAIQNDLQSQMKKELDLQRAKTNELLDAMQKNYDNSHTALAKQIVESMIGA